MGTEVTLGAELKTMGMRFLLQPGHQKGPWMLGEITTYIPLECPALKTERNVQTLGSSEPQKRPFLGDQFRSPDCTEDYVRMLKANEHVQQEQGQVTWSMHLW